MSMQDGFNFAVGFFAGTGFCLLFGSLVLLIFGFLYAIIRGLWEQKK